jgi:hypothetical protein
MTVLPRSLGNGENGQKILQQKKKRLSAIRR